MGAVAGVARSYSATPVLGYALEDCPARSAPSPCGRGLG